MYDTHNMPARTWLSHYLRTGQILPPESFECQKENQSNFNEKNFLSHKSWTTRDFWDHYFSGNGRAVDLASVGLLNRFQNSRSVRRAVNEFRDRQKQMARQKATAICRRVKRGDATIQFTAFPDRDDTVTDVTLDILRLFSVGRSTFFRSARSVLDVNCEKRTIRLEGVMNFSIDDAFIDAMDIPNMIRGDQDFEDAVPFKIIASWHENWVWGGRF